MENDVERADSEVLSAYTYNGEAAGRRTALGAIVAVGAQIVRLVIQLVGLAILSRLLQPGDFGVVAMSATASGLTGLFGDLGLSTVTIQRSTITQRMVSTLFFAGLAVALAIAFAMTLLSPLVAAFYEDARVGPLIIGLSLATPITALGAQHNAILTRSMRWITIQAIVVAGQAIGLAGAVLLSPVAGYWALVAQVLLAQVATVILQWTTCRWRPSMKLDWRGVRSELSFGLNVTGFALTNYLHRQSDNVLIGKRWGSGELGLYTRAYSIVTMPLSLINGPVGSALVPLLSRHQNTPIIWRKYFLQALAFTCFASHAVACVLFVNAEAVIAVALGPGWNYSGKVLTWLSLSLIPMAPLNAMGWVFVSLNRTKQWLRLGIATSVLFPIAYLIGLPARSEGVAIAYVAAVSMLVGPAIWYALRGSGTTVGDVLGVIRGSIVASLVTCLATLAIKPHFHFGKPVVDLIGGAAITGLIFVTAAFAAIWFDPRQRTQRAWIARVVTGALHAKRA